MATEVTVRNSVIAEFDGVPFITSGDRAPSGDQTSTLTTSNNVVQ